MKHTEIRGRQLQLVYLKRGSARLYGNESAALLEQA